MDGLCVYGDVLQLLLRSTLNRRMQGNHVVDGLLLDGLPDSVGHHEHEAHEDSDDEGKHHYHDGVIPFVLHGFLTVVSPGEITRERIYG